MYLSVMRLFSLWDEEPPPEGDPPGGGGGGDKDPPPEGDKPPKEGEGEGDKPPETLPLDVLPEDLRNRPAAEVKLVLDHMVTSLTRANETNEELKAKLTRLEEPEKPPVEDPHKDKSDEELMLEDADAAVVRVLQRRGMLDQFGSMQGSVGGLVFDAVAATLPGFAEHKDEVQKILTESKITNPTKEQVTGAFSMAVGNKAIEDLIRTQRAAENITPAAKPDDPPQAGKYVKTPLDEEIRKASDLSEEEYYVTHKPDADFDLEVPTG